MKNFIKTIILTIIFTLIASIWAYFDKSLDVRLTAVSFICGFLISSLLDLQDEVKELKNKLKGLEK